MKVIVPCAGKSSRFPNMRPKWMLNAVNGNLMVYEALKGLNIRNKDIIITILKKHEEQYKIAEGIKASFGEDVCICILDNETKSQSDTVYQTIKKLNINESIYIKDSDNYFEISNIEEDYNYVTIEDLNNFSLINPSNKSYIMPLENNLISGIYEKKIVSNLFSIGGYFFKSSEEFCLAYKELELYIDHREIYISDIISYLILTETVFFYKHGHNYKDWGTIKEWNSFKGQYKTYFIDIDGIVFKNGAQYFEPKWGETVHLEKNILIINKLIEAGNQIIFVTARTEEFRYITEKQLAELGIKYDYLIMNCLHSQRILINDFSTSNPYPSAVAINIKRDMDDLENYIN